MSYTKGPWKVSDSIRTAINSKDKHIAMINYSHCGTPSDVFGEEHLANAALIAAAPEMLEALESILCLCVEGPEVWNHLDLLNECAKEANEAITKAKGEE